MNPTKQLFKLFFLQSSVFTIFMVLTWLAFFTTLIYSTLSTSAETSMDNFAVLASVGYLFIIPLVIQYIRPFSDLPYNALRPGFYRAVVKFLLIIFFVFGVLPFIVAGLLGAEGLKTALLTIAVGLYLVFGLYLVPSILKVVILPFVLYGIVRQAIESYETNTAFEFNFGLLFFLTIILLIVLEGPRKKYQGRLITFLWDRLFSRREESRHLSDSSLFKMTSPMGYLFWSEKFYLLEGVIVTLIVSCSFALIGNISFDGMHYEAQRNALFNMMFICSYFFAAVSAKNVNFFNQETNRVLQMTWLRDSSANLASYLRQFSNYIVQLFLLTVVFELAIATLIAAIFDASTWALAHICILIVLFRLSWFVIEAFLVYQYGRNIPSSFHFAKLIIPAGLLLYVKYENLIIAIELSIIAILTVCFLIFIYSIFKTPSKLKLPLVKETTLDETV